MPDLGCWVSALTAMPPFFAVRLHRGGIFVGREVSSAAVVDLPQLCAGSSTAGLRGDVVRFRVSAGVASEQKRVQYGQNRVVDEIEAQGGVYPVCS